MESPVFSNRLSALIEENRAAEKAYGQVVQRIENKQFGQLLDDCIEERIRFQKELKAEMGEMEVRSAQRKEDAHPSWLHLHEIFPTTNDVAMLKEAILGEERSIEMYKLVIGDAQISKEYETVLRDHIKSLVASKTAFEELQNAAGQKA